MKRILPLLGVLVLAACGGGGSATPAVPGGAQQTLDWATWGGNNQRTNFNSTETTVTPANVGGLKMLWSFALSGQYVDTQPVVAANVNGHDLVYVADEHGHVYAVDGVSGSQVWTQTVAAEVVPGCTDIPDGSYGVTGSPVLDRANNRVIVVDGTGVVHAFNMSTGAPQMASLPIVADPSLLHVWSSATYVASSGTLYIPTASYCDDGDYTGTVVAVDSSSGSVKRTFAVAADPGSSGNGIWAWGGLTVDPDSGQLFSAVGNGFPENAAYSDSVLELNAQLNAVAWNNPKTLSTGDYDFGGSPVVFDEAGGQCLAVGRKDGLFFSYDRTNIGAGPATTVNMGSGRFNITTPAFANHLLYMTNTKDGAYPHGLYAFRVSSGCQIAVAWSATLPNATQSAPPMVANGVVYVANGARIVAFDAANGKPLWDSTSTAAVFGGQIWASPTIVNGRLYAVAWDGHLHAFGLPTH